MDVVKSTVEGMKGTIEVESNPAKGTKFILRLPLTLAVIKALLFEVSRRLYAVPISVVAEVTKITKDSLTTVDGKDTLMLRDLLISIIHLDELFRTNPSIPPLVKGGFEKKFAIILGIGNKKVGILVDRLIGQQELVIKAIDGNYADSGVVAGASILGDGGVILILDAFSVFKKAVDDEKKKAVRT
jgi:two-component system chemotaxis sensor kinase CheA